MAFILADRVRETASAPGTSTVTLLGAVTGYQTFSAGIGANNTTYYVIADQSGTNWEVGLGTIGAGGTTLARTTVLSSSNSNSLVNFSRRTQDVFCDYPANKAVYLDASSNVSSLGTITSGVWNGSTIPVANGGTGVTTSSGANSVVLRDASSNITANALDDGYINTVASGTPIVLTVSSVRRYTITGSGGQTIKLPDATTLANGTVFQFDNNQSSGAITVNNNSNTLVVSVPSGGFVLVNLLSNAIAAGSWDRHDQAPANVSWSTNTFDYAGSITSATWNGNAVAINRGGTGASTASTAFNNLSPLTTAGDTLYGGTSGAGTRLAIGTAGQVLTVNSGATAPQWSTPTTGTVTSVTGTSPVVSSGGNTPVISMPAATGSVNGYLTSTDWTTFNGKGSGTVTSITAGTGLSGGTITSTGTIAIDSTVTTNSGTQTLTNKWVQPRVLASTANSATPTLNTDNYDIMVITGQSVAITNFSTNLTGTPVNGQKLIISITGTGAIAITWGTSFESSTVTLPSTTVTTARLDVGFIWNVATSKWRCIASA